MTQSDSNCCPLLVVTVTPAPLSYNTRVTCKSSLTSLYSSVSHEIFQVLLYWYWQTFTQQLIRDIYSATDESCDNDWKFWKERIQNDFSITQ
jgi:hypothetical protein